MKQPFFGLSMEQSETYTVRTDADDKLRSLDEYPISRIRRKEFESPLNALEKSYFTSTNSSLGWTGISSSLFCSFYASHLQQRASELKAKNIIDQINIVTSVKRFGTVLSCPHPTDKSEYCLTALTFADASKASKYGQIGVPIGLQFGKMRPGSLFHTTSWISHKSKRPVKNVPAAATRATIEGMDESEMVSDA